MEYFFQSFRYLKLLLIVSLLALFSGCTSKVNIVAAMDKNTKLKPDQGIVVARLINTSGYPLPFNFLTIAPKNLNESEQVKFERLEALKSTNTNSSIFTSAVVAGSYSLSDIYSTYNNGDWFYRNMAVADAQFGTFEVKPGEVTDLGDIIYYPKPQEDSFLRTLARIPNESQGQTLQNFIPTTPYKDAKVNHWNTDGFDNEHEDLYISIAQNPVKFNEKYVTADNELYLIGKLGVIVTRNVNGDWDIEAVDTNVDLQQIKQNANKDLIIAGDEGKVFIKRNNSDWQDISLPENSKVTQINFIEGNKIELLAHQTYTANIYQANLNDDILKWQNIANYTTLKGWSIGVDNQYAAEISANNDEQKKKKVLNKVIRKAKMILDIKTISNSDTHMVSVTYGMGKEDAVFNKGDTKHFNYNPRTWQVRKLEDELEYKKVITAGAVELAIKEASFWTLTGKPTLYRIDQNTNDEQQLSSKIYYCKEEFHRSGKYCIRDSNKNKKVKLADRTKLFSESFNFVTLPWFKNDQEAIAIASFVDFNFWTGRSKNSVVLIKSNDAGLTWQKTELKLPNEYCQNFITEIKDSLVLFCNGASGDVYESIDFAKTWQQVREQQNF